MNNVTENFKEHFEFLDQTLILQTEDSKSDQVHFDRKRWIANQEFFRNEKKRSDGQMANLNYSLNVIMGHLVKHMLESEFYVKGMVYKEVQSGKTEHFNSLINLAFDNNYEIVIVLTGSQNDLRSQTQIRIDSDVVGQKSYDDDPDEDLSTGIGRYWGNTVLTGCITDKSSSGDINGEKTGMKISVDKNHPLIIVTKKNHDNLKSIIKLLRNNNVDNKAALIIDDESDLASIDTYYGKKTKKANNKGKSPSDPDYVPSSINAHIRKLLKVFNRKSYVAYTATPFANLLVNRRIEHPEYGHDLYPRDFVLAISSDKNYVGPNHWFGGNGRARPLVKIQKITPKGFADYLRNKKRLPDGLKVAIKAFVLSTSIRILRESEKEHNSMLIHTEMTNRVQELTYRAVRQEINALNQQIAAQKITYILN